MLIKKAQNISNCISRIVVKNEDLEYIVPLIILLVLFAFGKNDIKLLIMFTLYVGLIVLSSILEKDVKWKYTIIFGIYLVYMDFYCFMSLLNVLNITRHQLMISALMTCFYILLISVLKRKDSDKDLCLYNMAALQLPIPLLLFNLYMHRYNYRGERIIDISLGMPYYILVMVLVLCLFCINIKGFKKCYYE